MMDPSGNLYGTTAFGGIISASDSEGAGTVFKLTPGAAGTSWTDEGAVQHLTRTSRRRLGTLSPV